MLKQLKYTVLVKFNSSGNIQANSNEITIALKSKPERGKTNREMIEKIAEYFRISKDRIYIISGLTSNRKLIEIS